MIRRREFITLLGGAAAWPIAARAQQSDQVRRIGVLFAYSENDPDAVIWLSALMQGLAELGWTDGRNMQTEIRWAAASIDRIRTFAKELVDLRPDVIIATTTPVTAALQHETTTIPIVFPGISDPLGSGFVTSLSRPGGNITGFINLEASLAGKLLELLLEIAPGTKRAANMFNPDNAPSGGQYYLPSFETAARSLKVESIVAPVRSDAEIQTVIASLPRDPIGGLVVMQDGFTISHRASITSLASKYKVPAVYPLSFFVRSGGLFSYGPDLADIFRRTASYVDRIFRGVKPADLPVQQPTKFDLVVNLRAAKEIGLTIPESFLARADEVIE